MRNPSLASTEPPLGPRDQGSALVLALVFVLGTSLVITALLTQTSTSFRTTQVVRTKADKVYAADAGLEQAIETLRLDPTLCATPGATNEGPWSISSNDQTVDLTCTNEGIASSSGADGWSAIITGTASSSFTTQSGGTIDGPVFAANLGNPNVDVTNGSVADQSATCATPPSNVNIAPSPPYRYRCTTSAVPDPLHALPDEKPTPTDPPPTTAITADGPCQVFSPGTYTDADTDTLNLTSDNYFQSGTYYFENVDLSIDQKVIGGTPDPDFENSIVDSPACSAVQNGDPGAGTGIKWILGGTSRVVVGSGGHLELFARQGGAGSEGQMGISLQAATTVPGQFVGSSSSPLVSVNGGNPDLVVHGMLYAPDSYLDVFATSAPEASFQGGLVVQKLHLSEGGLVAAVSAVPGTRSVVVTATAQGTDGAVDVTATAVVELDNEAPRTVRVVSWRVE